MPANLTIYRTFKTASEINPNPFPPASRPAPILDELMALRHLGVRNVTITASNARGMDFYPINPAIANKVWGTLAAGLLAKKRNLPPLLRVYAGEEFGQDWAWSRQPKKTGQCQLCSATWPAGKVPWGSYFAHAWCIIRCVSPLSEPQESIKCPRCHYRNHPRSSHLRVSLCSQCRNWGAAQ